MNFFEGLLHGMGSESYDKFMDNLAQYLASYGIIMNMTCKGMRNFPFRRGPDDRCTFIRSATFQHHGHLHLLKWWYESENYIEPYGWSPTNINIIKWKLSIGLQDTFSLFSRACDAGAMDIIDYCIEQRLENDTWIHIDNVKVLDYLYRVRRLPINKELNMWQNGWFRRNEDVYVWAMQYQHDPQMAFSEYFETHVSEINDMVRHWSQSGFKNVQMMSRIMTFIFADEWMLSRDVCNTLTHEVASVFYSDWCECEDPANHERRKRIKTSPPSIHYF